MIHWLTSILITMCFCLTNDAASDHRVGNGANLAMVMLAKAKSEAANMAGKLALHPEFILDHISDNRIKTFLQSAGILNEIASDIYASEHVYDENENPDPDQPCAWTNDPSLDSLDHILFTIKNCAPLLAEQGRFYANTTLIHETLHHLLRRHTGIANGRADEEAFCREASFILESSFQRLVVEGVPYWEDISLTEEAPDSRAQHLAIWTGENSNPQLHRKMIIWGGCREGRDAIYGCSIYFADGGIYSEETDQWKKIPASDLISGRAEHKGVWSGDQLYLWGGCNNGDGCVDRLNSGAAFDPDSMTWKQLPIDSQTPSARVGHTATWTAAGMFVFGGAVSSPSGSDVAQNNGAIYNPMSDSWLAVSGPADLNGRRDHTAVYTGKHSDPRLNQKVLIYGGCLEQGIWYCTGQTGDGLIFDVATQTWKTMSSIDAPAARSGHSAVWTGSQMIVWGGEGLNDEFERSGGIYDLATDSWKHLSNLGPTQRRLHSAVWTGTEMIVFGGETANNVYATETMYLDVSATHPRGGRWQAVKTEFAPIIAKGHSAIWTGHSMIVWGGQISALSFSDFGIKFVPGIL